MNPQLVGILLPLAIVVPLLIVRNARPRKLVIERLWIRPVIFLALMGLALAAAVPPITVDNVALMVAALLIGLGLGWLRGRTMRIEIHPETHDLTARASPIGLVFIFALLFVRYGLRGVLADNAGVLGISIIAAADAFVLLAVGTMVAQGLEMWLRASRLLAEAQAAKAGGQMPKIIT